MAKLSIVAGATSVSLGLFVQDSSSTTGAGLTGLAFNTASLTCYSVVPGSSSAAITLATLAAANSAWSSGGFKEIDATNMPGWYRFDIPNTTISTGRSVGVHFKGASNMAPLPLEVELTAVNNQSATAFITGVNSLAPPTNWNLLSIDASGRTDLAKWIGTAVTLTSGLPDVNTKTITAGIIAAGTFAANALDAVWSTATRVLTAATNLTTALATPTNITAGTITTVTNLTNAPTAGDLTATMKTSVTTAATAATPALSAAGVAAIWAYVVEGTHTAVQYLRVLASASFGVLSGAATTTVVIQDVDNTKPRITATVDSSGNRSAITTDFT